MARRKKKITDESKTKETYEENLEKYRSSKDEVIFILENELKKARIKIHHIVGRVKTLESCLAKIERKSSRYSFDDITDIVGVRAVCLFMSDIERLSQIMRSSFIVHSEDNKIDSHEISSFGYMSFHFICSIKDEYHGPRYDFIKDNVFEIQVRTIAMDAWATISHYLDYKNETDVPRELRRDFYALSGLFYVADSHFEMFYNQSKEERKRVTKLFKGTELPFDQEINFDTMSGYLSMKFPDRKPAESSVESRRGISALEHFLS